MDFTEILDQLSKNIVFRLSLTGQELFYQNFWGWMLDNYWDEFGDVFDSDFKNTDKPEILFGKNGLNLSLKFPDGLYIIDNKYNAALNKEQLESLWIDTAEKNLNPKKILRVSYPEPAFSAKKWKREDDYDYKKSYNIITDSLTYDDLADKIKSKNPKAACVQDYIECLELLKQLKSAYYWSDGSQYEDFFKFYSAYSEQLADLNSDITFINLSLSKKKKKILAGTTVKNDVRISIGADQGERFTFEFWKEAEDRIIQDIGIAVHGYEYRYCAFVFKETDEGKSSDIRKKYSELLQKESRYKEFFKGTKKSDGTFYNQDFQLYTLLYSKENLPENITVKALTEKIQNDLNSLQ